LAAAEARTDRAEPLDFEVWVAEKADALLRFAYVLTGDRSLAEDAVQDALTTACARWGRVSQADDPEAYVKRMVVNAHISWWRRFRRREAPVPEPVRTARAVPDGTADRADADAVWELCASLPDKQRAGRSGGCLSTTLSRSSARRSLPPCGTVPAPRAACSRADWPAKPVDVCVGAGRP
jgi:DNA-directed RNA polymerase specialized sigma24 family protein